MGYAIAEAAIAAGHDVVLVSGPVSLAALPRAKMIAVSTSDEMFDAVLEHIAGCDIVVMAAAVADYRPAKVSPAKIKKNNAAFTLELVPARDILAAVAKRNRTFLLVGFAAETEDVETNALRKLREKNCDVIVANDAHIALESEENEVTVFCSDGEKQKISRASKRIIGRELVKIFENVREKSLTKKMC